MVVTRRGSKIRRQTLLFPIAITGWLGSAGPADLLGSGSAAWRSLRSARRAAASASARSAAGDSFLRGRSWRSDRRTTSCPVKCCARRPKVKAGARRPHRRCQTERKRGMTGVPCPTANHRRPSPRRRRRPASPRAASPPTSSAACCGRSGRSTSSLSRAISARCPSATAPWCGPSSRRCCAGSAPCGICSRSLLEKGLPPSAPKVEDILLIGAAQILFLDVPDHASVDLSVRLAQADHHASHYSGLVNAVLRKLARDGKARLAGLDTVLLDTPEWLMQRWIAHYGESDRARHRRGPHPGAGARSHRQERSREPGRRSSQRPRARHRHGADDRIRPDPAASRLRRGRMVGAGRRRGPAGAAYAMLWATSRGKSVADLCAAPGGKTAQLALAGAQVTAVDRSAPRLERVRQNLARLQARRRDRQGGCRGVAGRPVRRGAGRCAMLVDRHDPAASRHPVAQVGGRPGQARGPANPPARPRRGAAQAGRHAGLLHLLAGTRRGRGPDRGAARPQSRRCAAARSEPTSSRATANF